MKTIVRYSISAFVLIIIALRIYFYDPNPQYSGKKEIPGLQEPVDIFTDNYGAVSYTHLPLPRILLV